MIIYRKGVKRVKKLNEKKLLDTLETIEKLLIKIISVVGWIKILIDVLSD